MTGKGDKPRPVDREKFNSEHDRIFGVAESKCSNCKYTYLTGEHMRCLLFDGFIGIEKMKQGLIGNCPDFNPIDTPTPEPSK